MGRAYEVRKASIQKTGAIKAKTYSLFAKEIYQAAKNGTKEIESNSVLKRLVEKAKKAQVPSDIIDRAIEKAKGTSTENYETVIYEGFGPGASTLIIKCLTDNVNRTISFLREAFNKAHCKIAGPNSISYNYDHLAIFTFKSDDEESIFEGLLSNNINIVDFENENGEITVSGNPTDYHKIKDCLEKMGIKEYLIDETGMYPKERVALNEEDSIIFDRLYNLIDDIEDVLEIYHNVSK